MLALQGFPVCHTPPLTPEQVMDRQRRRARYREASMRASGADNLRANVNSMKNKKKGNVRT